MPTFFSKLSRSLGRKKDERTEPILSNSSPPTTPPPPTRILSILPRAKTPTRIETVEHSNNPTVSNSGRQSPQPFLGKIKSEDSLRTAVHITSFFRSTSPSSSPPKPTSQAPHLDLTLPVSSPADTDVPDEFSSLFGDPTPSQVTISDDNIAQRKLSPEEMARLLKASSAVIHSQGLETLGLFHPHWLSASRTTQRNLISLFLISLKTSNFGPFDADLRVASPHDVAAVLKWGLRHVSLQGGSFGTSLSAPSSPSEQWAWYSMFAEKERAASYPQNAFSSILLPLLPRAHACLLKGLLDLFSSVAAHADGNGMFNTKLSKALAWWVVSGRIWSGDGWSDFYTEWDRSARIMEHIFLCFLRDQSQHPQTLPVRLTELHHPYPLLSASYSAEAESDAGLPQLPPKPLLTTRTYTALLALEIGWKDPSASSGEYAELWEQLKAEAQNHPTEGAVPTDDYNRHASRPSLSYSWRHHGTMVIPRQPWSGSHASIPLYSTAHPIPSDTQSFRRRRSHSLHDARLPSSNGHGLEVLHENYASHTPEKAASSATLHPSSSEMNDDDWNVFSSSGFGTSPVLVSEGLAQSLIRPRTVGKYSTPPSSRRSFGSSPLKRKPPPRLSFDRPDTNTEEKPAEVTFTMLAPAVVQLDEAFVDTWADTLLDPTSASSWPDFALYQLKRKCGPVEWLIIERSVAPAPPETLGLDAVDIFANRPRASSPGPSLSPSGRFSTKSSLNLFGSVSPSTKKRFSGFFGRLSSLSSNADDDKPIIPQLPILDTLESSADEFGSIIPTSPPPVSNLETPTVVVAAPTSSLSQEPPVQDPKPVKASTRPLSAVSAASGTKGSIIQSIHSSNPNELNPQVGIVFPASTSTYSSSEEDIAIPSQPGAPATAASLAPDISTNSSSIETATQAPILGDLADVSPALKDSSSVNDSRKDSSAGHAPEHD
ncbi:hypothetical protein BS47DRAFT_1488545 [Hydnum rufescens UP504]|uniref:Meiotically up-regulated protein Msb1/Mug8 domain-containing protein n=1 Tax=Hydnum rufescens UP504 TaxID=1448309 RepID=A0A9P6ALL6_9AGAM|nr:hypothetical protein BS47DRAFT_1488545 [Hydnum rufescens UP504]